MSDATNLETVRRVEVQATAQVIAAVTIWGCTPRVTAVAGPYAEPLTLTSLRAAPAAVVLLIAVRLLRFTLPRGPLAWAWTAAGGLLMVTVFLGGFTEAVIRSGPGTAIVLASTAPFFAAIFARTILREQISALAMGGLVAGFGGVVMIVSAELDASRSPGDVAAGTAFALAAAVGWAAGTLLVARQLARAPDTDLVGLTTGQHVVGGAALAATAFVVDGAGGADWSSGELWLAVSFISVVGSGLATIAYLCSLRSISATRATAWTLIAPVVAVVIDAVLGDGSRPVVILGMAITIAGVAIVNLAPARASQPGPRPPWPDTIRSRNNR